MMARKFILDNQGEGAQWRVPFELTRACVSTLRAGLSP